MKIKNSNSHFEACPEYTGKAVIVDVTPLRKQQSQFGERDVFKVVFEVEMQRDDGTPYCVWSKNFTPTLNEKSNFRCLTRARQTVRATSTGELEQRRSSVVARQSRARVARGQPTVTSVNLSGLPGPPPLGGRASVRHRARGSDRT
jgi:hypothetical protein